MRRKHTGQPLDHLYRKLNTFNDDTTLQEFNDLYNKALSFRPRSDYEVKDRNNLLQQISDLKDLLLGENKMESKRLNENHILTPEEYVNYDILIEEQPDFRFTNAFVEGEYLVLERWDKNRLTHSAVFEVFDNDFGLWLTERDFYYAKAGEYGWLDEYYQEAAEFFDTYEEYIESEIEQLLLYQEDYLEDVGLEVLLYI